MTAAEGRRTRSGWQRVRPVLMLVLLIATGWALAQQAPAMSRALATTQVHWGWMAAATAVVLATYALLIQGWRLLLGGFLDLLGLLLLGLLLRRLLGWWRRRGRRIRE